jgi:hypothetical protein
VEKRRGTRIAQAVPLIVTGVDALGCPFEERTSTSIINCHGCRYPSKHYLLKNMWMNLEVPHPELDREPRRVRARVTWIQRPRTVREPFQVGVELETPGNFWGIAFPPADWFLFPEDAARTPSPQESEATVFEERDSLHASLRGAQEEYNERAMPAATSSEGPVEMSQQMARLVDEARQQLHAAISDSVAQAVALEVRQLQTRLEADRNATAKQWDQRIEALLDKTAQETADRLARQSQSSLERLENDVAGRIATVGKAFAEAIAQAENKLTALRSALESEKQMAEESLRQVQSAREQLREEMQGSVIQGRAVEQAAEQALEQRAAALLEALDQQIARQADRTITESAERLQSEINSRATALTNNTCESLRETAEWYQKKLQTQVQATLEKRIEEAGNSLKEKAREISGIFASELDHYSRSYVEHTRGQLGEAMRETLAHTRQESAEMASTLTREALAQIARNSLAGAKEELVAQLQFAKQTLLLEMQEQEKKIREALTRLSDQNMEDYEKRLENVSNSWLLTPVARLSLHSEQHMETLARLAEERLHEIFSQVFAGMGETLRRRLLDLSAPPATPSPEDQEVDHDPTS